MHTFLRELVLTPLLCWEMMLNYRRESENVGEPPLLSPKVTHRSPSATPSPIPRMTHFSCNTRE